MLLFRVAQLLILIHGQNTQNLDGVFMFNTDLMKNK